MTDGGGSRRVPRPKRNERGTTLIMTALLLPVLVGFAALSLGATTAYVAKNDLQRAADLGATAAAAMAPTVAVSDAGVDTPLDPAVFDPPFGPDGLSITKDLHLDCPAWPPPSPVPTTVTDTTTTSATVPEATTTVPATTLPDVPVPTVPLDLEPAAYIRPIHDLLPVPTTTSTSTTTTSSTTTTTTTLPVTVPPTVTVPETTTTEVPTTVTVPTTSTIVPTQPGNCSDLTYGDLFDPGLWDEAGCYWAAAQLGSGRSKVLNAFQATSPGCDSSWDWENEVLKALAYCAEDVTGNCVQDLADTLSATLPAVDDPALANELNQAEALADEATAGTKKLLADSVLNPLLAALGPSLLGDLLGTVSAPVMADGTPQLGLGLEKLVPALATPQVTVTLSGYQLDPPIVPTDWLGFLDISASATARRTFKSAVVLPSLGIPKLPSATFCTDFSAEFSGPMGLTVDEAETVCESTPAGGFVVDPNDANRTGRDVLEDSLDLVDGLASEIDPSLVDGVYDMVCGVASSPPTTTTTTSTTVADPPVTIPPALSTLLPPVTLIAYESAQEVPATTLPETETTVPAVETTVANPSCPGFPSLPTNPAPIFESFMRDLYDLTAPPPAGTEPSLNDMLEGFYQSGDPVLLVGALKAVPMRILVGDSLWNILKTTIPGLSDVMFVPALDVVPALIDRPVPNGPYVVRPLSNSAHDALATQGLYKARLVK